MNKEFPMPAVLPKRVIQTWRMQLKEGSLPYPTQTATGMGFNKRKERKR